VDGVLAPAFGCLKEKFAFTPISKSLPPHVKELATPPSSVKQSRIPRAIKPPAAAISSTNTNQLRVLTPLQSLGAKALNRPSALLPSPPFTPKPVSTASLPRLRHAAPSKFASFCGVPFPEVARPSSLKVPVQLDPVEIPLPVPDKHELVALSIAEADDVENQILATIVTEGKGSEDLIVRDSEEELDDEVSSPIEKPSGFPRLGLDKFAFRG
jgi:hypothetical protein